MSTVATSANRISYTGDGVSLAFAFPYLFLANSDLSVYVAGSLVTTGYSVSGAGTGSGTVTFVAAPAVSATIEIVRAVDFLQQTQFPENGPFPSKAAETAITKTALGLQRINDTATRALRLGDGESFSGSLTLPNAATRALHVLAFDASGSPMVIPGVDSSSAAALALDLASATNAAKGPGLIGFGSTVAYARGTIGKTVQDGLGVNVKDKGATGDGSTNDLAAFLAAFASSKRVHIPSGTYFLGSYASSDRIIDLTTLGDDITITTGDAVELICTSTGTANPVFFYLRSNSGFRCGRIRFRDTGYDRVAMRGAIGFTMDAFGADWHGVHLEGVYAKNCYTGVVVATKSTTRVRGINIGYLAAIQCNRGYCGQDQGDGVNIGLLYAEQVERALYVYGITGLRANIYARNNYGTTGVVNISRAVGGYNTSGIEINYVGRDTTVDVYHVNINHIDLLGGEISGIRVNVDIRGSVAYDAVRFVNYTGSGGSETSSASSNVVADVTISGSCDAQARAITAVASYSSKRRLQFTPGRFFEASQSLLDAFAMSGGGLYSPAAAAWSAPTPPSLGNGSLARDYTVAGGLCTVNYNLTIGSTSTMGTGDWTFKLPAVATANAQGAAYVMDSGTAYYAGVVRITAGSDLALVYAGNAAATAVRSNTPMTWASGDQLAFSITYPISS